MTKSTKRFLIIITNIFLIVVIAFLIVFFCISNGKTEIYADSYDGQVRYSLGSYSDVEYSTVESRTGNCIAKPDDAEKIVEEQILAGDGYLASYDVSYVSGSSFAYHVTFYEGYYFVSWVSASKQLNIENLIAEFAADTTEYFFPFPVTDMFFSETGSNTVSWDDLLWIADFAELATFYGRIDEKYCLVDENAQTVRLNGYDANNFHEITTEYPITLSCDDEGIVLNYGEDD